MIITILIAFFSIIGLLVIHEFGHFIIAKRFGVKVEEFGIGYPPRLFGVKVGETLYSVNLIPFGAFVRIPGEGKEGSVEGSEGFAGKSILERVLIILGGVVSFWIVAIILLSIVYTTGVPRVISDDALGPLTNPQVQIVAITPGSPAEAVGIRLGDAIKEIMVDGLIFEVQKVKDVQELNESYKGKEIILVIQRGQKSFEAALVPRISPPEGEGPLGVALVRTAEISYPFWQAPIEGVKNAVYLTKEVVVGWVKIIGPLVQGEGFPKGVQFVGPLGIGSLLTQAAQVGVNYFLNFIATISIYLAVLNIMPIPALDGGKLVFLLIEKFKGRPVNRKIENNITAVVFILLLILMVWITIKDISRIFF